MSARCSLTLQITIKPTLNATPKLVYTIEALNVGVFMHIFEVDRTVYVQ